ncbi:MAG: 2-oxoacid:ferredoxin oxidoreductase subunit gamma [Candidatus Korarchaeota archaeon]|nr:2-oxoacid:ferredoxin oxidoreductase subunit gamma [Candidatus Korarchaeota archaeon]NIU85146.1 2-oxoacid:ferredoxin oxidoreductase subunit gamma [Candidatus Thorarchaeota archaeon]NIW15198.1 2-oxoacid:ferredoxin oxidoreductase subunit gamma [Candidatus Thorarchaeota archaeon]NIW53179.1 2-oxoacid:ferredoxin oxidoreductase subunit gamma [Candidatus Korarchaeota archaeon]
MREINLRISGRGGQGIVLAGKILGTAIAKSGKEVMYTQEYGSRARGGVVYSDLIISDSEVNEVLIEEADVLVVMSQNAFNTQLHILKEQGTLIVNGDLVALEGTLNTSNVEVVPFTTLGRNAGHEKTANMAMIAYLNERFDFIPEEDLKRAMQESLSVMLEENRKAFELGRTKATASKDNSTP